MNSSPAESAVCANVSISLQSARQRFTTLVKAVPPSALIENSPSLNRFAFLIGFVVRADMVLLLPSGTDFQSARDRIIDPQHGRKAICLSAKGPMAAFLIAAKPIRSGGIVPRET